MKTQILLLASLSLFAFVHPVAAAPDDSSSSTSDADHQFLEKLEKADAARGATNVAPTAALPTPSKATPAPIAKVQKSREVSRTAESKVVVRKPPTIAFGGSADISAPSEEAAEVDPAADPSDRTTTVVVVRPLREDRADRHHHERHDFFHRLFGHIFRDSNPDNW